MSLEKKKGNSETHNNKKNTALEYSKKAFKPARTVLVSLGKLMGSDLSSLNPAPMPTLPSIGLT